MIAGYTPTPRMEATYNFGSDMELARMCETYLFKVLAQSFDMEEFIQNWDTQNVDARSHLDLTMSLPPNNNNRLHNLNNYISSQTFHAPSFGDEDFELPPISIHSIPVSGAPLLQSINGYTSQQLAQVNSSQAQHGLTQPLSHPSISVSSSCSIGGTGLNNHNSHHQIIPKFPPQNIHIPDIMSMSDNHSNNGHMTYTTSVMSVNSLNAIDTMNTINMNQLNSAASTGYMSSPLTTISHSDLSSQLGIHGMTTRQALLNNHHQGSPSGSSNTSPVRDSSEDSDDMLPLAQLALKRSAADQTPVISTNKKQKTPKKKKKKDPNEPQKPVSAYALFFRDTQAAIKGQNPNASFGEVSKIVASMWDSLDPEHKNMYKKKTETAKKEYLKQLAAYRASLVSKTANTESLENYEKPHPKPLLPNTMANQVTNVPNPVTVTLTHLPHSTAMSSPPHQGQIMMTSLQPQPHPQQSLPTLAPRPPMQQTMQTNSPHSVRMATSPVTMAASPVGMATSPIRMIDEQNMQSTMRLEHQGPTLDMQCIRTGCQNRGIESPDWDNEFCSNECVVSHCGDVFNAWVSSNSFASVK